MSDRYAPIPYSALAVAGPDGQLAVLDLYTRGHTARWAPILTSERDLMVVWKVDQRKVSAILAALSAAGLIDVVREKWQPTLIRVFDPAKERPVAAERAGSVAAEQSRRQSGSAATVAAERAGSVAAESRKSPQRPPVDTRVGDPTRPDMTKTPAPNPRPSGPGADLAPEAGWVSDLALSTLQEEPLDQAEPLAERWSAGHAAEIDRLVGLIKGSAKRGKNGQTVRKRLDGAPEGLRRRHVLDGVRDGVRRWRAHAVDGDGLDPPPCDPIDPKPPPEQPTHEPQL